MNRLDVLIFVPHSPPKCGDEGGYEIHRFPSSALNHEFPPKHEFDKRISKEHNYP